MIESRLPISCSICFFLADLNEGMGHTMHKGGDLPGQWLDSIRELDNLAFTENASYTLLLRLECTLLRVRRQTEPLPSRYGMSKSCTLPRVVVPGP